MSPTDAGTALFERGSSAMQLLFEVEDDVRAGGAALTGVVRIAAPGALGRRLVAPTLRELLSLHPGLSIELQVTDQVVSFVQGLVPFAVRVGLQTEASLAVRPLGTSHQQFVATRGYIRRHGKPKDTADLVNHTLLARGGSAAAHSSPASQTLRRSARLFRSYDRLGPAPEACTAGLRRCRRTARGGASQGERWVTRGRSQVVVESR